MFASPNSEDDGSLVHLTMDDLSVDVAATPAVNAVNADAADDAAPQHDEDEDEDDDQQRSSLVTKLTFDSDYINSLAVDTANQSNAREFCQRPAFFL
jgi:hypothetical protein